MSNDFEDYHRPSGGDGYRNNDFHSGLTEYRRPRGVFNRKRNPYSRSNMIYAKKKRRWPMFLIIAIILVLICVLIAYACGAFGGAQAQTELQQPQQTAATQAEQTPATQSGSGA